MKISFEMNDNFGDGLTVEVTEEAVRFYDGLQDFSFTKEQFSMLATNVAEAFAQLRML